MGWLFCIATLIVGLKLGNDALLIASGLFGIAGAIAFAAANIKTGMSGNGNNNTNNNVQ